MANPIKIERPKIRFAEMEFSGGEKFTIADDCIVVFVGPNNGGKTTALRGVEGSFGLGAPNSHGAVIASRTKFDPQKLVDYLSATDPLQGASQTQRVGPTGQQYNGDPAFLLGGGGFEGIWAAISSHFIKLCGCRNRESVLEPVNAYDPMETGPSNPLHFLSRDADAVTKISNVVKEAFGLEFYLYAGGARIYPYLGTTPKLEAGENGKSPSYVERNRASGKPATQNGDGVVNFTSLIVTIASSPIPIILIDEPEAFLHPPQARLLGRAIAENIPADSQLFIATHSTDFLQGLLENHSTRVHVVRVTRSSDGKKNYGMELPPALLNEAWSNPLVRHTPILDGLFHDIAIVAEADGDCELFRALVATVQRKEKRARDVFLMPVMGNARLADASRILKACGVVVAVSTDFDTLAETERVKKLFLTLGGDWAAVEKDHTTVVNYVTGIAQVARSAAQIQALVSAEISGLPGDPVPDHIREKIRKILREPKPWAEAKKVGATIINNLPAREAWDRLDVEFRKKGLYVIDVGELESFASFIPGHGPAFVMELLEKVDVGTDVRLRPARNYVRAMLGLGIEP